MATTSMKAAGSFAMSYHYRSVGPLELTTNAPTLTRNRGVKSSAYSAEGVGLF
jgi:hypothetical protein